MTVTMTTSTQMTDDAEVRLLNEHLCDARHVHLFVVNSLTSDDAASSTLLRADVQAYLRALLHRYTTMASLRRRLVTSQSLHYLRCLTEETWRDDFVRLAASPLMLRAL